MMSGIMKKAELACCWLVMLLLAGCAASGGANTGYLLEQDYRKMSNPQLIAYEQELGDEIGRSGSSSPEVSLGLGVGSWGSHAGFGVGVEQPIAGGVSESAIELRQRRDLVRAEMRRRGLLPPAEGVR